MSGLKRGSSQSSAPRKTSRPSGDEHEPRPEAQGTMRAGRRGSQAVGRDGLSRRDTGEHGPMAMADTSHQARTSRTIIGGRR